MGNVKEISGKELEALVEKCETVVCDFWASWCGPCRMLGPVLEELAEEFKERATFVKVNVDENGDLAASLGIFSIPDVYIFAGGDVKTHNLGFLPEEQMRAFLQENLK